jgi:hypothetical protein
MFANVRSDDGDSQITNSVRQPAVEERLIGWPPAIIYLTKQPPDSTNRDGYEPAELPVTAAMIAAGAAVVADLTETFACAEAVAEAVYRAMRDALTLHRDR